MKETILLIYVVVQVYCGSIALPAGLRPAKAVGDPVEAIVPNHRQGITADAGKMPANLSVRSRMMAALSATPTSDESETTSPEKQTKTSVEPPIVFKKSGKKSATVSSTAAQPKKAKAKVPSQKPGIVNYGLNTVLQTNLVDSRGRVMKGVNSVPIKVASTDDLKNARTRHTAREVESGADKIVPIKFGSASSSRTKA